jgi:hypothetical protein
MLSDLGIDPVGETVRVPVAPDYAGGALATGA